MAAIVSIDPNRPVRAPAAGPPTAPGRSVSAEVYRRRRLVVAACGAALVVGLLSLSRDAGAARTPEAEAADSIVHVVEPGDTLWAIAQSLAPGHDPRPLVDALAVIADGPLLQPGQRLVIPAALLD